MPITSKEHQQLTAIIKKINDPSELMALTRLLYDSILEARISSQSLLALGKLIYAKTTWKELPAEWAKLGGNSALLNKNIRFPLLKAAEEFFLPEFLGIFQIHEEPENTEEQEQTSAPAQTQNRSRNTAPASEQKKDSPPVQEQIPTQVIGNENNNVDDEQSEDEGENEDEDEDEEEDEEKQEESKGKPQPVSSNTDETKPEEQNTP